MTGNYSEKTLLQAYDDAALGNAPGRYSLRVSTCLRCGSLVDTGTALENQKHDEWHETLEGWIRKLRSDADEMNTALLNRIEVLDQRVAGLRRDLDDHDITENHMCCSDPGDIEVEPAVKCPDPECKMAVVQGIQHRHGPGGWPLDEVSDRIVDGL